MLQAVERGYPAGLGKRHKNNKHAPSSGFDGDIHALIRPSGRRPNRQWLAWRCELEMLLD